MAYGGEIVPANFRVTGTPVISAVPEKGGTALLLLIGASALFAGRFLRHARLS